MLSAEVIDVSTLTDADAAADGFASGDELRRALAEMYPSQEGDGKAWYRLTFEVVEPLPRRGEG